MTEFFIPELDAGGESAEAFYSTLCQTTRVETGHAPISNRIFRLWFRRGGTDIEAEVGKPDPISGETVLAILDLGRQFPYVIHCGRPGKPTTQIMVDKHVYAVTVFGDS